MSNLVFERPIIILSAPRSGSTLLYETLIRHSEVVSIRNESHAVIETIEALHPYSKQFSSGELDSTDATTAISKEIKRRFAINLKDNTGGSVAQGSRVRFIEKTPKNALRISFLLALFPDALFVYLVRNPDENISSIMQAWQSNRFITYPHLPGFDQHWSLLLPAGWQHLKGKPLANIAAFQWQQANVKILAGLSELGTDRVLAVNYQTLINNPQQVIGRICDFAGLSQQDLLPTDGKLPLSAYTLTKPDPDKWQRNRQQLALASEQVETVMAPINQYLATKGEIPIHWRV